MQTAKQIIEKEISQSLENAKCMNKAFAWLDKAMGLDKQQTKHDNSCCDSNRKDSPPINVY